MEQRLKVSGKALGHDLSNSRWYYLHQVFFSMWVIPDCSLRDVKVSREVRNGLAREK